MVEVFGATSTTDEVLSGVNLQGKRILVTGVSAGLGVETARSVVAHGPRAIDLMIWMATLRSRQVASTSSNAFR